jgi:hypothetical protein
VSRLDTRFPKELGFIEPNVALIFEGLQAGSVRISARFSQEFAPPWLDRDVNLEQRIEGYEVRMTVELAVLRDATDTWEPEITRFPERPSVEG